MSDDLFEKQLMAEREQELRKKGLLRDGETIFDYGRRVEQESEKRISDIHSGQDGVFVTDEDLIRTHEITKQWRADPTTKNVSVDPYLTRQIFEAEARRRG